jgi:hypothetical protein
MTLTTEQKAEITSALAMQIKAALNIEGTSCFAHLVNGTEKTEANLRNSIAYIKAAVQGEARDNNFLCGYLITVPAHLRFTPTVDERRSLVIDACENLLTNSPYVHSLGGKPLQIIEERGWNKNELLRSLAARFPVAPVVEGGGNMTAHRQIVDPQESAQEICNGRYSIAEIINAIQGARPELRSHELLNGNDRLKLVGLLKGRTVEELNNITSVPQLSTLCGEVFNHNIRISIGGYRDYINRLDRPISRRESLIN